MFKILKILVLLVLCFPLFGQTITGGEDITTDLETIEVGVGVLIGHYSANPINNGLRYGLSGRIQFRSWELTIGGGAFAERKISPSGGFIQFGLGYSIDTGKDFYIVPGILYYYHKSDDRNLKTSSFIGPRFMVWHDLGGFRYGGGFHLGYLTRRNFFLGQSLTFSFDIK